MDDNFIEEQQREVYKGEGVKAPGYYVQRACGLFPAPMPQVDDIHRVATIFRFLGSLFAKCLQDGRLIDLPISKTFLKLLCTEPRNDEVKPTEFAPGTCSKKKKDIASSDFAKDDDFVLPPLPPVASSFFHNILTLKDLEAIDPIRYKLLSMLFILCDEQERIMTDITLSQQEKQQKVDDLVLDYNGTKCRVNDLGLTFQYNPPPTL